MDGASNRRSCSFRILTNKRLGAEAPSPKKPMSRRSQHYVPSFHVHPSRIPAAPTGTHPVGLFPTKVCPRALIHHPSWESWPVYRSRAICTPPLPLSLSCFWIPHAPTSEHCAYLGLLSQSPMPARSAAFQASTPSPRRLPLSTALWIQQPDLSPSSDRRARRSSRKSAKSPQM